MPRYFSAFQLILSPGTISDFLFVSVKLGLQVTFIKPGTDYGVIPDCLYQDNCGARFLQALCAAYDYIIVGDIVPDGRAFLSDHCLVNTKVKVILQATNRFDLVAPDIGKYHELVRKRLTEQPDRVYFIANNPFEAFYLCRKNINPPRHAVIRATGFAPNEYNQEKHPETFKGNGSTVAFTVKAKQHKDYLQNKLKELDIPFRAFEGSYGGPQTLATYKAVIQLPYQVSVMSLPENLRHGTAYLLPTPSFFLSEFCTNSQNYDMWHAHELCMEPSTTTKKIERLTKWTDWWQPELQGAVAYFGSWEELKEMVKKGEGEGGKVDFEDLKRRAKGVAERGERRSLEGWREVLGMGRGERVESIWQTERIGCGKAD
ncbi:hypothetical protein HK097_007580 [Rhizophlyctis rosea]|uniref:Uncharacterized protein n=1 Tax=Rhizophlyctis rosea TaxID=64517 RepID=A0AAD5SKC0_9FUNG|nr:hypothetical protein HK097_007580 [Rhizophlyctis rosea]